MPLQKSYAWFAFLFLTVPATAHPVPFKGALSVMTWNQPYFNETMTTYSFHRKAAIAGQYMRMDMDEGEMKAAIPQFNYLIKRWNELESQANIYAVGGWGSYEMDKRSKTSALSGLELDWESRRYYLSGKVTSMWANFDDNTYVQTVRAGVSAYPAEFDEISAWVILDVQHINRRHQELTVTPVLRTFYKNFLTEIGASFTGEWMLNFMVHL